MDIMAASNFEKCLLLVRHEKDHVRQGPVGLCAKYYKHAYGGPGTFRGCQDLIMPAPFMLRGRVFKYKMPLIPQMTNITTETNSGSTSLAVPPAHFTEAEGWWLEKCI